MAYRETKLGLRIRLDPQIAKKQIIDAFKSNGLVTGKAAEALDVSVSALKGYVVKLDLSEQIDKLREKSKTKNFPSYDRQASSELQKKLAQDRAAATKTESEPEPEPEAPKRRLRRRRAKKLEAEA